jgi:septation ring formation regulator EzrA
MKALEQSLRAAAISDGIIDDASRCLCHEAANRIEVLEKDIADTMGRLARVTNSNREQQQAAQEWADKYKSLQQKLAKERQARAEAEGENARLVAALLFCDSFADQCETAEDRSNLDGDSAEAVLLQINEAAFEARAKIAQALAPAPAGGEP